MKTRYKSILCGVAAFMLWLAAVLLFVFLVPKAGAQVLGDPVTNVQDSAMRYIGAPDPGEYESEYERGRVPLPTHVSQPLYTRTSIPKSSPEGSPVGIMQGVANSVLVAVDWTGKPVLWLYDQGKEVFTGEGTWWERNWGKTTGASGLALWRVFNPDGFDTSMQDAIDFIRGKHDSPPPQEDQNQGQQQGPGWSITQGPNSKATIETTKHPDSISITQGENSEATITEPSGK